MIQIAPGQFVYLETYLNEIFLYSEGLYEYSDTVSLKSKIIEITAPGQFFYLETNFNNCLYIEKDRMNLVRRYVPMILKQLI